MKSFLRRLTLILDHWRYKALPHRFYCYSKSPSTMAGFDDWDWTAIRFLGRDWFRRDKEST